jgi:NAD(P)H-hydrate repair Nnr-like enzyme with NAD(P)H-hydrate dehydratase domain
MSQVYTNAEGTGGTGDALAETIFAMTKTMST